MNVLLDTCALIWTLTDDPKLSQTARAILRDPATVTHVSAVSLLEMAIKISIGKLAIEGVSLPSLPDVLTAHGARLIAVEPAEAVALAALPFYDGHHDPFDRLLVVQAMRRNLTLVSPDDKIPHYRQHGLALIW
ncbi:MAG: type II toxin-antitoxin system VapC family toxin [Azoarcus sp.]|jgi:PIN domain nuclease of toxin-antitoxin system|nr:type II toxin-antitoxin system VapC family toxin [Azoarcus sp.]